ncbi:MAG: hypothetical protein K8S94_03820 [Planctomycetia bacterium]|nr:hypothetical protein [Planctomycetia bacterium]
MNDPSLDQPVEPVRPAVLWVGACDDPELALARTWADELADVFEAPTPDAAVASPPEAFLERSPAAVVLASPTPARWSLVDCITLSRRWPLAPLVSVAGSLVEGRRRSGPALPGVEEVAWNELPGRMAWWMHDCARGRPGSLGMPTTSRREERLLEAAGRVADFATQPGRRVSVAASRASDVEGLADVLTAAGRPPLRRTCGRPALDEPADILVWDVSEVSTVDLTWLAMLTANRPRLAVVLLDSFPRSDSTLAVLRAGGRAVLSRPMSLETLAGMLLRLETLLPA